MIYTDPRTGSTLGGALGEWRIASEMTLGQAAEAVGVTITHLFDVENDKIGPSANLLLALGRIYRNECVGPSCQSGWAAVTNWLGVFSGLDVPTNRQMLNVVAASLRQMRNLPDAAPVGMRGQEGDLIFSMLDMEDGDLAADLSDSFGLTLEDAEATIDKARGRLDRRDAPRQPILERIGDVHSSGT